MEKPEKSSLKEFFETLINPEDPHGELTLYLNQETILELEEISKECDLTISEIVEIICRYLAAKKSLESL